MSFLDLLFPLKCIICGEPVKGKVNAVCRDCAGEFNEMMTQRCEQCGMEPCECECYPVKGIDKKYILFWYKEPIAKRIIFSIKRKADIRQVDFMAEMLSLKIRLYENAKKKEDLSFSCVCNVPRDKKAIRKYGYDQSELIAKKLSQSLGLPYMKLLERTGRSAEQKTLSGDMRSRNTKGIFKIKDNAPDPKSKIDKKGVLIADDVTTSGATLSECAAVLRSYGFKTVKAAVFAQSVNTNIKIQNKIQNK